MKEKSSSAPLAFPALARVHFLKYDAHARATGTVEVPTRAFQVDLIR